MFFKKYNTKDEAELAIGYIQEWFEVIYRDVTNTWRLLKKDPDIADYPPDDPEVIFDWNYYDIKLELNDWIEVEKGEI
jgi:hypothetical protein